LNGISVNKKRFFEVSKLVSFFFSLQILIQGVDAVSGLIIVRNLSKVEYAYFGIITTLSVSVLNIIISGLLSFFISNGVKLKENKFEFSKLFNELKRFLNKKLRPFFLLSIPLLLFMLYKNGITEWRILIIIPLILLELIFRIKLQLQQSVLNIYNQYNKLQLTSIISSIIRFFLIIASFNFLSVEIAYLTLVVTYAIQFYILKQTTKAYLIETAIDNNRKQEFESLHRSQLPLTLYGAFDAQLVILLLTFLGGTELLGDVNAAGKLSLIVVAVNAFVNNVLISKFANIHTRGRFIKFEFSILLLFLIFYTIGILISVIWPSIFIFLIGEKYTNISSNLYLMVIGICIVNLSSIIYSINFSKVWIKKNWIIIPFTILMQFFGILTTPPNSFRNVSIYIILCALPSLFVNIYFNIKGVKNLAEKANYA
jgi:hypothetical protein